MDTAEERFNRKWQANPVSGCWNWSAGLMGGGTRGGEYGQFRGFGSRKVYAHRFAWELAHGPVPSGLCVCHRCDNPRCVNVAHLFLGTQKENAADKVAKGRHTRGETHPSAKMTTAKAQQVRVLCLSGATQHEVARRFGISQALVSLIATNKLWKKSTGPTGICGDGY